MQSASEVQWWLAFRQLATWVHMSVRKKQNAQPDTKRFMLCVGYVEVSQPLIRFLYSCSDCSLSHKANDGIILYALAVTFYCFRRDTLHKDMYGENEQ